MKLFRTLPFVCTLLTILLFAVAANAAPVKIAVVIFSDEARYVETRDTIVEAIKKGGYADAQFQMENAANTKTKAAEIALKLAAAKPDMIIGIGTNAVVPLAKEIKDTPIVFTFVFDPIESKIAATLKSSGNNTTGTTNKVPVAMILDAARQIRPIKRLGVVYTPGQSNSEATLKDLMAVEAAQGIKIVPIPLAKKEEVGTILADAADKVDALQLTGSSVVGDTLPQIVELANRKGLVTLTHLDDHAERGVLLGVTAAPAALGQLTANKALKVLKGAAPSDVSIDSLETFAVMINLKSAKAAKIEIPSTLVKKANRLIQ